MRDLQKFAKVPPLRACPVAPLADWLVVDEAVAESAGGLLLPGEAKKQGYFGRVLAAGPLSTLVPGAVVFYHDFGRVPVTYQEFSAICLRETDLQAVLKENE